jgi:CRP-like cAMP-binding protein
VIVTGDDMLDALAALTLFADLSRPRLEAVAHTFEEEWFDRDRTIVRQGFHGSGFYVVLEGEASVRIDGQQRATLARGDFFGEVSVLLGELPSADVIAISPLRCVRLPGEELSEFLHAHPSVMYRMLQSEARRLRTTSQWRP